ncbi:MAG: hypothetical protein WBG37_17985 [Desulfobacterales bacterium]
MKGDIVKIIELMKKVGLLRYGVESGPGVTGDFYGHTKPSAPPTDPGAPQPAPSQTSPTAAAASLTDAPPTSTGRVMVFGLTVATAVLAIAIFLLAVGFSTGFMVLAALWIVFIALARRFAFSGKPSGLAFGGLFCGILMLSFLILGLSVPDSQTATAREAALAIEQIRFAKPGPDGILEPVDSAKFTRGEEVHLVLIRVSGFQAGADGRCWYDLDAKLTGPEGQVMVQGTDILGQAGHRQLPDGVAKAPEAQFKTTLQSPPGSYTVFLTIKDKISGLQNQVSRTFTLS